MVARCRFFYMGPTLSLLPGNVICEIYITLCIPRFLFYDFNYLFDFEFDCKHVHVNGDHRRLCGEFRYIVSRDVGAELTFLINILNIIECILTCTPFAIVKPVTDILGFVNLSIGTLLYIVF